MRRPVVRVLAGLTLLMSAATAVAVWAVGFGVLTTCTNDYSCSQTSCPPCRDELVVLDGALVALLVAFAASLVLLVRGRTSRGFRDVLECCRGAERSVPPHRRGN